MKDILDIIIIIMFIIIVFGFIRGFNKQQVNKHVKKLDDIEEANEAIEKTKEKND